MGELAARTIFANDTGPLTGTGLDTLAKNQGAILELEGAQAPQSKTITSGSISPTAAYVIVDTEGSAAADDLDVISPVLSASENLHDGMLVNLKSADSGRVVTVKNSSSANGINTYDGNDYVLSSTHWLKLQLRSGKWYEVEGRAMETALAAASAAATASTPATTTSRGIARVATLADMEPGAEVANGPAFLAAGVHTSVAAAAGKIPIAGSNGHLPQGWFGTMLCNQRTVITTSGTYTHPIDGWVKKTVIGAGGGGGKGGTNGGNAGAGGAGGGQTVAGGHSAPGGGGGGGAGGAGFGGGGGGGCGSVIVVYQYLSANSTMSITIGAGGTGAIATTGSAGAGGNGTDGTGATANYGIGGGQYGCGGTGGKGGGSGSSGGFGDGAATTGGPGGGGGSNGTGYGGGGGGGGGCIPSYSARNGASGRGGDNGADGSVVSTAGGNGGDGGGGAVIIEYFNPSVTG